MRLILVTFSTLNQYICLVSDRGDGVNKSSSAQQFGLAPHQVDFPDFLLACHARDRTGERLSAHPHLNFSFYPCMKPPCSPLMGEGLGVRVRVPAVVTFPALVITTISFGSISQHKLLGNLTKFVGGLAPKKPNPSKKK